MKDEVKLQHDGLFPYFSKHLFYKVQFPFEKVNMDFLLSFIPEMNAIFEYLNQERLVKVGEIGSPILQFPEPILDSYHLTENTFLKRVSSHLPGLKKPLPKIRLELNEPIYKSCAPFLLHSTEHAVYFPMNRSYFFEFPEIMAHYLLLYNLSMLSRYETEWWGELLNTKPDLDYIFISHFLSVSADKIPLLLGNELCLKFK